jgi:hypothetical protein
MHSTKRTVSPIIKILPILLVITVHSFLMNGFFHSSRVLNVATYVTPIVAQSDPSLFNQSLYVQSLKEKSARLSLMHELTPSIISRVDFETFALIQWFFCLFFTITALFYLGKTIGGSAIAGYGTALLFSSQLNDWTLGSPAIYINFFHHGLQWAIMLNIFSLALILQKRLPGAFLLMGIAWNFHPMSVLFLFFLFASYWLAHRKEISFKTLLVCGVAFTLPALPMLIKAITYLSIPWQYGPEWMTGVLWNAWYTVFPSTWALFTWIRAGLFLWLFVMGFYILPPGRIKRDIRLFMVTIGVLCTAGTVFAELFPLPFIMKMSLWRTTWLYIILALPCIVHLFITQWDNSLLKRFIIVSTLILLTGYINYFPFYYLLLFNIFFLLFISRPAPENKWKGLSAKSPIIFFASLLLFIAYQGLFDWGVQGTIIGMGCILLFLLLLKLSETSLLLAKSSNFCIIGALVFMALFDTGLLLYRGGTALYYHGYVRGERDPWAEIQLFAKENSHKDALFIVPPYCNDFGLYSERATLGDWAEGANILYMDNTFAKEWLARMNDLGWRDIWGAEKGYKELSTKEIVSTAQKYGADFIVTEKPKHFELTMLYENKQFVLYKAPVLKE